MTFTFNKDHRDHDQVAHLWDAYEARFLELDAAGKYPYNDDFVGHLGDDFASRKDQDSAIYLLQSERHERVDAGKVFAAIAEGCEPLSVEITETPVKFARVVHYEFQNGRTGYSEFQDARLVRFHSSLALLLKGKRTNGILLSGKVLVSQKRSIMTTTITEVEPHVADKIEPGAILYSSWGYDQTNIDFYYVVRTTAKSAWIVPMTQKSEPTGFMAETVMPDQPAFFQSWCECRHPKRNHRGSGHCEGAYGDSCECTELALVPNKPQLRRIQRSTWRGEGQEYEFLSLTSYSSASLWEGGAKHATHYA